MGDDDELGLAAHFGEHAIEASDVGFVERRVHFVENAERAGRVAEDGDKQRERGESLFAAGEKQNVLQALARRLRDDVDAGIAGAIGLAEAHLPVAAAEEGLERDGELRVDEGERVFKFCARDFVELVNSELRVLDGLHEVVALAPQEVFALLAFLEFLKRHHVDRAHGLDARFHFVVTRFSGDQLFTDQ